MATSSNQEGPVHQFNDQIRVYVFESQEAKRPVIKDATFRAYCGASSMIVLIGGQVRFITVSSELKLEVK